MSEILPYLLASVILAAQGYVLWQRIREIYAKVDEKAGSVGDIQE